MLEVVDGHHGARLRRDRVKRVGPAGRLVVEDVPIVGGGRDGRRP
jgi:hypothetical protein